MSYFNASLITDLYISSGNVKTVLRNSIAEGRARYAETQRIVLPSLISKPEEVWAFHLPLMKPNFITQRTARGTVWLRRCAPGPIEGSNRRNPERRSRFRFWIISHGIAGFVTAYGRANPHMAIRAGELNLPAVIGAGETLYNRWCGALRLFLSRATKRVDILA